MNNDKPLLDSVEPELFKRVISRRSALGSLAKIGAGVVTAPLAFAAMATSAFGKSLPGEVLDVLRFALLLEHLEDEFYDKALEAKGLIPERYRPVFNQIKVNEDEHVKLLATATASPILTKEFDYTANGRFPDVFENYSTFLAVAQTFEDTGVRAYKGQAGNLIEAGLILSIALRIHSVEARHACEVRRIRHQKGWIVGSSRGNLPPFSQPAYNGEGNTLQAGVNVAKLPGATGDAATEAFDEPLSKAQVMAIVQPFIKSWTWA